MNATIILLGSACLLVNIYIVILYGRLAQSGLDTKGKRISLKILKEGLEHTTDSELQSDILKCLHIYRFYLVILYFELGLILVDLIMNAN